MDIVRHAPPPKQEPPPTYDIRGLTAEQAGIILWVCEKSTWVASHLFQNNWKASGFLNDLYHALRKAGVSHNG